MSRKTWTLLYAVGDFFGLNDKRYFYESKRKKRSVGLDGLKYECPDCGSGFSIVPKPWEKDTWYMDYNCTKCSHFPMMVRGPILSLMEEKNEPRSANSER